MCLCYLFTAKTAWQLVNRKADFFYKTNRFESIRIANWNALVTARSSSGGVTVRYVLPDLWMTSYLHAVGHHREMSILLQQVTSLQRRAQANTPPASHWLLRVYTPRLDEFIVQRVSGRSLQWTVALFKAATTRTAYTALLNTEYWMTRLT